MPFCFPNYFFFLFPLDFTYKYHHGTCNQKHKLFASIFTITTPFAHCHAHIPCTDNLNGAPTQLQVTGTCTTTFWTSKTFLPTNISSLKNCTTKRIENFQFGVQKVVVASSLFSTLQSTLGLRIQSKALEHDIVANANSYLNKLEM